MGFKGKAGAFLQAFNQSFSPYAQAYFQHRLNAMEQRERMKQALAEQYDKAELSGDIMPTSSRITGTSPVNRLDLATGGNRSVPSVIRQSPSNRITDDVPSNPLAFLPGMNQAQIEAGVPNRPVMRQEPGQFTHPRTGRQFNPAMITPEDVATFSAKYPGMSVSGGTLKPGGKLGSATVGKIDSKHDISSPAVRTLYFDTTTGKYYDAGTGQEWVGETVPKGTIVRNKIPSLDYQSQKAETTAAATARGSSSVEKPLAAETAGKLTLVQQGISDIDDAMSIIFNEDGSLNNEAILGLNMPMGGFGEEGRMAYSKIYNAIEGKLRAETGAAAPDSEIKRIANRFLPKPAIAGGFGDTQKSATDKLLRLRDFLENTSINIDPKGNYSYQRNKTTGEKPSIQNSGKKTSSNGNIQQRILNKQGKQAQPVKNDYSDLW